MPPKKKSKPVEITSTVHKDKRTNIPTEELRDFVTEAETAPKAMLYPRDPSLDPQLVWRGKDEQDAEPLAVPVVPIYIQEKVHPQCIIEALPRIDASDFHSPRLFADFNGGLRSSTRRSTSTSMSRTGRTGSFSEIRCW